MVKLRFAVVKKQQSLSASTPLLCVSVEVLEPLQRQRQHECWEDINILTGMVSRRYQWDKVIFWMNRCILFRGTRKPSPESDQ